MATTDLMVGIGAEYKGRGAFNKANKDILGLGKGVRTLAKAYIGLAGAQKAFRYGSQSIKAFAEDDLAAQKLAKTVENLGLAYEATNVENFIQGLERTYHVADDLLRPAFSKLISTTQSYTKAKELMNLALNASVGSGVDLNTTVNDLTQAYVGNTRGLNKYKLGLTKAELAAKSFDELQQIIAKRFTGQASQAANTYAAKIDALTIASGNAKEIIGKGLVEALTEMSGKKGDVVALAAAMEELAAGLNEVSKGFGILMKYSGLNLLLKGISAIPKIQKAMKTLISGNDNSLLEQVYGKYDPLKNMPKQFSSKEIKLLDKRAKADALSAKRQKELAKLALAAAKTEKDRLALARLKKIEDKASLLFNMDLIENTAALMGRVTEDETLRLKTQQAILLGNSEQAGALAQELLAAQTAAMKLANFNPVGGWPDAFSAAIKALQQLRDELAKLGIAKVLIPVVVPQPVITPVYSGRPIGKGKGTGALGNVDAEGRYIGTPFGQTESYVDSMGTPFGQAGSGVDSMGTPFGQAGGNGTQKIEISINPAAMAYGISAAVIDNNANGNSNTVSTIKSYAGGA